MAQYKVPGAYVVELEVLLGNIAAVQTAVPLFIGYTERAGSAGRSLTLVPQRIESIADYEALFGGPPPLAFTYAETSDVAQGRYTLAHPHLFVLHASVQLYFLNGGGPCFVVSVGSYAATPSVADFAAALALLEKELDVTLVVAPDVASLTPEVAAAYPALALAHCAKMQSRVAILDVPRGDQRPATGADDPIAPFRASVGTDALSYGAAYYPWLNTTVRAGVDFRAIAPGAMPAFQAALQRDAELFFGTPAQAAQLQALTHAIASLAHDMPDAQAEAADQLLTTSLDLYRTVMADILARVNLLPPSAAMAGIYCKVDQDSGVFTAPANISPSCVASLTVALSDADQQDLNTPLDGKAVNAIRMFPGLGILVWGARTLDGNSQDFRYISVRRTLIMLEQSIKAGVLPYAFLPNEATTWASVSSAINLFLYQQWQAGAFQGAGAADAYAVDVGLGTTMSAEDVLNGWMRVTVKVALVHPAEFIVMTFQQQMGNT